MARSCLRITVAVLLAVGLTTCTDAPTAQRKGRAGFAVGVQLTPDAQQIASSLPEFGMAIDRVHVVVTRPPSQIVKDAIITFPADSNEITIALEVPIDESQETLTVRAELLDGSQALFAGSTSVVVREGQTTTVADPINMVYIGPGASARTLTVAPPNAVITLTASKQFTATARDANQAVVTDLPINWTSSDASIATVASNGQASAASNLGQVTITAKGLNGIQGSATLTVIGRPARFAAPSLDGQTGPVNTTLPAPFQVVLQTDNGTPVPGATIAFQSLTPGGSVGSASATTDDQGRASTTIKLGTASGPYTFQASLTGSTAVTPVTISATATPGTATQLVLVSGPSSPTSSGAPFTVQPLLQRRDQFGNLVQVGGVEVTASVPSTHSLVGVTTVSTSAGGVAQFNNLGVNGPAGPVVVTFAAGTLTTTANVTVVAGQPASIAAAPNVPTTISAIAGSSVPNAQLPAVIVKDASGNPVPGVSITVTASAGTITVPQGGPFTDANGVLKLASWTLPTTVGSATVSFVLANVSGSPVVFTANIVAGTVATLTKAAGDAQSATVNTPVGTALAVVARDQFGNPVPNAAVTFTPSATSGAVSDVVGGAFGPTVSVQTDGTGTARASWRLGTTAGPQTLDASAPGAANLTFTATATPGTPAKLVVLTPPNTPQASGAPFATQPVIQRQDQFNNAVPGTVAITASVPNGFAVVGGTANTNAAGTATFAALAVSGPVGPVTITFSSTGVTSATSNVTLTSGQVASITNAVSTTLGGVVATQVPAANLPAVLVRDGASNPVQGVTVSFAVTGGSITSPSGSAPPNPSVTATTDASGIARLTSWTLPTAVGPATVTATLNGASGSPVTFTANVTNGAAAKLVLVTPPNSPTGSGALFTSQPSLQIRDQFDNPFPQSGIVVTASVPGTHSLVGTTSAQTNASGVATFTNLGVAGPASSVTITFSVASLQLSTTANVTVVAGSVASISANTPTALDGVAGSALPPAQVPAVIVLDGAGNPVRDVSVTFAVNGGTITPVGSSTPQSPISALTDASGIARIGSWTAPTIVGTATVTATLGGANGSPVTFVMTVSNGPAARLVVLTHPNSPTASGAAFTTQPAVQVQDQFGNAFPVSGINVVATVAPVVYTLSGSSALTNVLGIATYSTLGVTGPTGAATITFSIVSLGLSTTEQVSVVQPTVSLTTASQTANEGTAATITAQLSSAPALPVTVPYTVTGTATNGTDYTIAASPLVIPAGSTSGSVTVNIATDGTAETDETVIVTLGTPTNATLGQNTVHTLTIAGQTPNVSWTAVSQAANEGATATVTAQLSSPSTQAVTVPFTVSGTASGTNPGQDYTITASPLAIAAGATTASITVNIAVDGTAEPNETVVVTMGTPTNANAAAPTVHTLTINGQTPNVSWTAAAQSASEGGAATITAQLSSPSTQAVTVPFTVSGTAVSPADYTITASPLTIAAGSTTASITVNIVNDGVAEPGETVIVTMGTPTNANAVAPTTHTVTIAGQTPSVTWTTALINASEGATTTVTAQLSTPSTQVVTVPFTVSGTATLTTDYTITSSPLTIPAGATSASISITSVQDQVAEPDETVIVTMGTPTNATPGTTTVHTLTIVAQTATVSWTAAAQTANEGTSATITAQLSSPSSQAVTVPFTVSAASTASNPADYTIPTTSPLTIPAGSTTASITVNLVADAVAEPNETVIVTMGTPTNAIATAPTTHTLTIAAQTPNVSWTAASQSANEGSNATITAQLSSPSTQAVTVPFTVSGTAVSPSDYTITASPLTIPAGSTSASITVNIVADGVAEPDETVSITMGAPTNATAVAPTLHTLTISGQTPTVSWTAAAQNANEGAVATVTAQLSGPSSQVVTVPFTVTGTATNGSDYTISASPLTIPVGSTSASITVNIAADGVAELSETVIVTMGTPTNANAVAPTVHTLTIASQTPTVSWTTATQTVNENVGTATITAQLAQPSTQSVTVPFTVSGTATNPADYTITGSPLTIPAGSSSASITVTIVNDAIAEPNETVVVTMGAPTNATPSSPTVHTLTIAAQVPTVRFVVAAHSVSEGTGSDTVFLQLSSTSTQTVTVPFSLSGTATNGVDYAISPSPVTISAGSTSGIIVLSNIVADGLADPNETVIVTLGAPTNATLTTPSQHVVTITDAFRLTIGGTGGQQGTLTSSPAGINCVVQDSGNTGSCNALFAAGTVVTLTATPAAGNVQQAWADACANATVGQPCVLTMNSNLTATAHFVTAFKTISVTSNPTSAGVGTVATQPGLSPAISCTVFAQDLSGVCQGSYVSNTLVTLTAGVTSGSGNFFQDWSGACTGTNPVCTPPNPATGTVTVTPRFGFNVCNVQVPLALGATTSGTLAAGDCVPQSGQRQDTYVVNLTGQTLMRATMSGTNFPPEMHTIVGNFWFVASSASPLSQFYLVPPGQYPVQVLNRDANNFGTGAYTFATTDFTANGFPAQCNHVRTNFGVNVTTGLALANGDCAYIASNRSVTSPSDAYSIFVPNNKTLTVTVSTFTGIAPLIEFRDGFDDNASFTSTLFATSVSQTGGTVTLSMVGGGYVKIWVTGRAAGTTGGYTLQIAP